MIITILIIGFVALAIAGFLSFIPVLLWIESFAAGVKVSLGTLIGMRLRRVRPYKIIKPLIRGTKAGLDIDSAMLEGLYLAGGDVDSVVNALIASYRANINLDFEMAKGIQLAGRNVYDAVQMSVKPKVIEIPKVAAIAKDGIELNAKAKVTVRANLDKLIGGAGEETIIARVGEGIVTTVGSAETHKKVLENPDSISKTVLSKGLDSGTAYEILSIDIADVDVGRNVGAKLQMHQAEADKNIAQATAEVRRAMAVAQEQEMKAQVVEMQSKLVEAEAEVPKAISKALRDGKLGVMDYYNMKNVMADTEMRKAISDIADGEEEEKEEE